MLRKKSFTFLFIIISFYSYAHIQSDTLSEKEIYNFINWFIKEKSIKYPILRETIGNRARDGLAFANKVLSLGQEYGFSFADTSFLRKEVQLNRFFYFDSAKIPTNSVVSERKHRRINDSLRKRSRTRLPYYQFSIPFYSSDRSRVLLIYQMYCHDLCGELGYYIYKFDGKNYQLLLHKITAQS